MTLRRPANRPRAFTLVELMISIGLALILIYGINRVFKMTADTVGAGQSISTMTRDSRAAENVLRSDVLAAVTDPPIFAIYSESIGAFLTKSDLLADPDGDPTTKDGDGDHVEDKLFPSNEPFPFGDWIPQTNLDDRRHRIDRLMFFARGNFEQQAPNGNDQYVSGVRSNEAYVWYGHLRQPGEMNNPNAVSAAPGRFPEIGYMPAAANAREGPFHEKKPIASNWALGRMAVLLKNPLQISVAPRQHALLREPGLAPPNLTPLSWNTSVDGPAKGSVAQNDISPLDQYNLPLAIWRSRFDLAGTTISQFRQIVSDSVLWDSQQPQPSQAPPGVLTNWYRSLVDDETFGTSNILPFRFEADPYVARPVTGTAMARAVPLFLPRCTQFVVEYAGDYLTQEDAVDLDSPPDGLTPGKIMALQPDGVVDFFYDKSQDTSGAKNRPASWVRKVRWYGFPRDTAGNVDGGPDGHIYSIGHVFPGPVDHNNIVDVVPLRDIRRLYDINANPAEFERFDYGGTPTPTAENNLQPGWAKDYSYLMPPSAAAGAPYYLCIWRNQTPKMVRILYRVDDANDRVANGRWSEYVFTLK